MLHFGCLCEFFIFYSLNLRLKKIMLCDFIDVVNVHNCQLLLESQVDSTHVLNELYVSIALAEFLDVNSWLTYLVGLICNTMSMTQNKKNTCDA